MCSILAFLFRFIELSFAEDVAPSLKVIKINVIGASGAVRKRVDLSHCASSCRKVLLVPEKGAGGRSLGKP